MKYRILIALVSTLLAHCAVYMGMVLFTVWREGVVYVEPNRLLLFTEMVLFFLYALIALGCLFYMIREFLQYYRRVKDDHR